jgi:meiosis-specific transcription factor NDT80
MPQSAQNGKGERECSEFPFPELECCADLICEGHSITPDVKASMDKGFFWDPHDQKWTCYRRNYFSVHCYYTLTPNIPNGRLFLKRSDGTMDLVQAIGIRVQAAVDAPNGKTIELIQHTPKRDAGPKTDVKMFNMMPAMSDALTAHQLSTPIHGYTQSQQLYRPTPTATGPSLAFQDYVEPPSPEEMATAQASRASGSAGPGFLGGGQPQIANPGQETTHLFERIQFKCATANNGKRRATQQYFHLVAELHVDTRKAGDPVPQWNLVAKRTSDKVVVRGRSPSHYQDNANGGNGRGNGGAGSKFGGGSGARNMGHGMGPQMRSPGAGSSTTAGASMGYSGTNFGSFSFRTQTHYGLQGSPSDSGSGSDGINSSPFDDVSGSSGDGVHNSVNSHTFDESHQEPATISGSGRGVIRDINGYGYYPSPMYGGTSHQLPVPKSQGQPHVSTEPRDHAFRAEFPDGTVGTQWHFHGNQGQFQPWKNSKNLFPHIGGSYS